MSDLWNGLALVRFHLPGQGARVGIERDGTVYDLTAHVGSIAQWLRASCGCVEQAIADLAAHVDGAPTWAAAAFTNAPAAELPHWLPPVDQQDVWAAGVTYARSRVARQQEAVDGGDVYARVYGAERPELFFKARAPWVVGSGDRVGIRRDAVWNVPEPEIALLLNPVAEVVGFTAGNDMSSRDIEGENPLYLPQAKIYERACALGPRLLLAPLRDRWPALTIHLHIERDGVVVFEGETQSANLRRTPAELVDYLCRALPDHDGLVLLTGTGIVPPESFTLAADDLVTIEMDGVGTLQNRVVLVGRGG